MPTKTPSPWLRLLPASILTTLLYLTWTWIGLGNLSHSTALFEQSPVFLALWAGLYLLYAIAVHAIREARSKSATIFVLSAAVLFRASVVPIQLTAPPALVLSPFELAWHHLPFVASSLWLQKALVIGADIGALALAPGLLKAAGLSPAWVLIYGWNPLVIKETAIGAHFEPVGLVCVTLAILLVQRATRLRAALAYGGSLACSFWSATCLPLMMSALGVRAVLSLSIGASAWAYLYLSQTLVLPMSLTESVGGSLLPASVSLARIFVTRAPLYPAALCFGIWLAVMFYRALWKRPQPDHIPSEALLAVGGFLMIAPQVLPWHFTPLAYFAAFSKNRGWLVFTATAPVTYLVFQNGQWSGWSFWLGFLQYFPAYFTLIFGWLGRSRK